MDRRKQIFFFVFCLIVYKISLTIVYLNSANFLSWIFVAFFIFACYNLRERISKRIEFSILSEDKISHDYL